MQRQLRPALRITGRLSGAVAPISTRRGGFRFSQRPDARRTAIFKTTGGNDGRYRHRGWC
jgi:hypothetical protein